MMSHISHLFNTSSHRLYICCVAVVLSSLISIFSFEQISKLAFYLTSFYFSFGLSKIWWTPEVRGWINAHTNFLYKLHGPAITLLLLFCHTYGWLKFSGGIIAMALLWSLGSDLIDYYGKWDYDSLLKIVQLNLHHHGGMIAFYFQKPEDALLNALLFGHFWWIHSYSGLGIEDLIKNAWEKVTGHKCTKFGHGYACFTVLFAAIYCYYMPIGFSYHACAIVPMVFGRNSLFDNWLNIEWMGYIETPGVIFCFTCKAIGFKTGIVALAAYVFYFRWRKNQIGENIPKPPRFFMTEKIRKFLDAYPRQEKDEEKIKEVLAFFESNFKDEFPLFRAVVESDEVKLKELIDNGADPNEKEPKFQSTPMEWVSGGGHINCACVLLEAGVNPFAKGVSKSARQHGHTHFLKFLDELNPLVWEAIREETAIHHERQTEPMTWEMAEKLAENKGGRLCTVKEAESYLMGAPLFCNEMHVCAVVDENGNQKWIHVGNKRFKTGLVLDNESDPKFWGNDLKAPLNEHFKWNKMLIWTFDFAETGSQTRGIESGA